MKTFIVALVVTLLLEALGIALVGLLGVVFANLLLATSYPIWYGWFGALTLRTLVAWVAKCVKAP